MHSKAKFGFKLLFLLVIFLALTACSSTPQNVDNNAVQTNKQVAKTSTANKLGADVIRFLFTADLQSRFLPFNATVKIDGKKQKLELGGFARLMTALENARATATNSITVSGGDDTLGRFFNYFNGVATMQLLEKMKYEVICPGNHEFDKGETVYAAALRDTKFAVICANAEFHNRGLRRRIKPHIVKQVGGYKVGFFGLIIPYLRVTTSIDKETKIATDLAKIASEQIKTLKSEGADIIVALTHLGLKADVELANQITGIDIILGAHSHKYTEKPVIAKHLDGSQTIVINGGERAKFLCQLDATLHKTEKSVKIVKTDYKLIPINADLAEHKEIKKVVEEYLKQLPPEQVIATTPVFLNGEREDIRNKSTNLGNFICDAILQRFKNQADFAIYNSGGIRCSIKKGDIKVSTLEEMLPFGNTITILTLTGKDVILAFEHCAATKSGKSNDGKISNGAFLQVSKNVKAVFDTAKKAQQMNDDSTKIIFPGERIKQLLINGQEVQPDKTYRVATNSYVANGGNGYVMFKGKKAIDTFLTTLEVIVEAVKRLKKIEPTSEQRLIFK